jgi:cholesterol transport system auxiliary component
VQVTSRHSGGMRTIVALALALTAAGCSSIGLGGGAPPTFDLTAPTQFGGSRAARGQLVVQDPTTIGVLDSDKIVVRTAGGEITALPNAQWADRLPRLVQVRLVQTFENSRRIRSVGRPGDRLVADYQLLLDIRSFEIVAVDGASADVSIAAKIVGDRSGRIVAARVFQARVPATNTDGGPASAALDAAWEKVAVEIVHWATGII